MYFIAANKALAHTFDCLNSLNAHQHIMATTRTAAAEYTAVISQQETAHAVYIVIHYTHKNTLAFKEVRSSLYICIFMRINKAIFITESDKVESDIVKSDILTAHQRASQGGTKIVKLDIYFRGKCVIIS
jgi:hypothetical protein